VEEDLLRTRCRSTKTGRAVVRGLSASRAGQVVEEGGSDATLARDHEGVVVQDVRMRVMSLARRKKCPRPSRCPAIRVEAAADGPPASPALSRQPAPPRRGRQGQAGRRRLVEAQAPGDLEALLVDQPAAVDGGHRDPVGAGSRELPLEGHVAGGLGAVELERGTCSATTRSPRRNWHPGTPSVVGRHPTTASGLEVVESAPGAGRRSGAGPGSAATARTWPRRSCARRGGPLPAPTWVGRSRAGLEAHPGRRVVPLLEQPLPSARSASMRSRCSFCTRTRSRMAGPPRGAGGPRWPRGRRRPP